MFQFKNFLFVGVYTLLLSILFFVAQSIFSYSPDEEKYIEPSLQSIEEFDQQSGYYSLSGTDISKETIEKKVTELLREKLEQERQETQKKTLELHFIPVSIQEKSEISYLPLAESFLTYPEISRNLENLGLYFYKNKGEVRGRMKSAIIHMFGIGEIEPEEFLSVFIHEYGHYQDIHVFQKGKFGDESQRFYDISWQSQNIMKKQVTEKDFVSGYAMTNQYEDFAESYVYYILHNKDFYARAQGSSLLREKYDFFEKYVFSTKEFFKEDFSSEAELKSYYWDITKIPIDVEKFLQYLQKEI